jgi:hypothetical protein
VKKRIKHLIALLPPGSVEAEVSVLQNALFDTYGSPSAIALPPLIPVGFVEEGPAAAVRAAEGLAAVCAAARSPYFFRSRGLQWERGCLFVGMESAGAWELLRASLGASGDGPFPVAEGFVLGLWDIGATSAAAPGLAVPSVGFSSCSAAILDIMASWEDERWWRELYVEISEKRPLRGRKSGLSKTADA